MSRLNNLLRQVETHDSQLAADLKREMEVLSGRRAFGLNFERHIPETVELPNRAVRRGGTRFGSCRSVARSRAASTAGCGGLAGFGGLARDGWPTWSSTRIRRPSTRPRAGPSTT